MREPVVTESGVAYERSAIEQHLGAEGEGAAQGQQGTCPKTGAPIRGGDALVPLPALAQEIADWQAGATPVQRNAEAAAADAAAEASAPAAIASEEAEAAPEPEPAVEAEPVPAQNGGQPPDGPAAAQDDVVRVLCVCDMFVCL